MITNTSYQETYHAKGLALPYKPKIVANSTLEGMLLHLVMNGPASSVVATTVL